MLRFRRRLPPPAAEPPPPPFTAAPLPPLQLCLRWPADYAPPRDGHYFHFRLPRLSPSRCRRFRRRCRFSADASILALPPMAVHADFFHIFAIIATHSAAIARAADTASPGYQVAAIRFRRRVFDAGHPRRYEFSFAS
jgi:hypothetical protein